MTNNSEALQRIKSYHDAFCNLIKNCKKAEEFLSADYQDAYARAARVRDRYKEEKDNSTLCKGELEVLSRVFDKDVFTQGIMNIRHVGEHVKKREAFIIRTTNGAPIELPAATSAMAMFANVTVTLNDTAGKPHRIDHLQLLEQVQLRVETAIRRAERGH